MQTNNYFAGLLMFICLCVPSGAQNRHDVNTSRTPTPGTIVDPKTDHIKTPKCVFALSEDYATYALYYHVEYTDGKPSYDLFVEANQQDINVIGAQCQAFLKAMHDAQFEEYKATQMARDEEAVQKGMEEMKQRRDAHFFLHVTVAKK